MLYTHDSIVSQNLKADNVETIIYNYLNIEISYYKQIRAYQYKVIECPTITPLVFPDYKDQSECLNAVKTILSAHVTGSPSLSKESGPFSLKKYDRLPDPSKTYIPLKDAKLLFDVNLDHILKLVSQKQLKLITRDGKYLDFPKINQTNQGNYISISGVFPHNAIALRIDSDKSEPNLPQLKTHSEYDVDKRTWRIQLNGIESDITIKIPLYITVESGETKTHLEVRKAHKGLSCIAKLNEIIFVESPSQVYETLFLALKDKLCCETEVEYSQIISLLSLSLGYFEGPSEQASIFLYTHFGPQISKIQTWLGEHFVSLEQFKNLTQFPEASLPLSLRLEQSPMREFIAISLEKNRNNLDWVDFPWGMDLDNNSLKEYMLLCNKIQDAVRLKGKKNKSEVFFKNIHYIKMCYILWINQITKQEKESILALIAMLRISSKTDKEVAEKLRKILNNHSVPGVSESQRKKMQSYSLDTLTEEVGKLRRDNICQITDDNFVALPLPPYLT